MSAMTDDRQQLIEEARELLAAGLPRDVFTHNLIRRLADALEKSERELAGQKEHMRELYENLMSHREADV